LQTKKNPMNITLHSPSLSIQTPFNPIYHTIQTTIINKTLQINKTQNASHQSETQTTWSH
jgi:hypothetical protein